MSAKDLRTLILLLPEWRRCQSSDVVCNGVLAEWCGRGRVLASIDPANDGILRSCFTWTGGPLAFAALRRQAERGDAEGSLWLCADPAHIRADMTTARMLACGEMGLTDSERERISHELAALFGDAGFEFDAPGNARWYVRLLQSSEFPLCDPPEKALGNDLKLHLPSGAAAKLWRRLFNDAQILLHNHRVNAERAARGAVSVNSLWFWGGGALPNRVRASVQGIFTDRLEVGALADRAGIARHSLAAASVHALMADAESAQASVLDLTDLRDQELERDWLQPLRNCLRERRIDALELRFASGECFQVNRWQRMKFWKPIRPLAT